MAQPRPPSATNISAKSFPSDLGNVGYYMTFIFSEYNRQSVFGPATPMMSGGAVALPMPDSINDNPTVDWEQTSVTEKLVGGVQQMASSLGVSGIIPGVGAATAAAGLYLGKLGAEQGLAINPFLIMLFKSSELKRFRFSWTLTPRTADESDTLNDIIKTFRRNMQPEPYGSGLAGNAVLKYPLLVKPEFNPQHYMFKFKQCAIKSINVDYTGAGMPAFFTTDAPVAVKLDIELFEVDTWTRRDLID